MVAAVVTMAVPCGSFIRPAALTTLYPLNVTPLQGYWDAD